MGVIVGGILTAAVVIQFGVLWGLATVTALLVLAAVLFLFTDLLT